jgi:aspartate/methionine/tyrosine aminotransferase
MYKLFPNYEIKLNFKTPSKTFGKGEYNLSDPEQRNVLHAFGLSESLFLALSALIEKRDHYSIMHEYTFRTLFR